MFLYKRNIYFILENLILFLLLSHFLVNISTANTDKVALMLFSQGWGSADEHTLTQLSFSDKYQRWNNIGSSTLNWHRSFIVVSTLLSQRWNNVHKHTSAQLSFSTKFQRWNNVGSSSLNGCNSIDALLVLFCQHWNNVDKCALAHFQPNINFETTLMNVDNQRRFNVDVFAGDVMFFSSIVLYGCCLCCFIVILSLWVSGENLCISKFIVILMVHKK